MNDTNKIIGAIVGAGLLVGGGIALDNNTPVEPTEQVENSGQIDTPPTEEISYVDASEIEPAREMTKSEQELDFKVTHGEALLPTSKNDPVVVKDRYQDRNTTVEARLGELEQIIKDAKANIERTQGILENASIEYDKLLDILNK